IVHHHVACFVCVRAHPRVSLFPYTTLFRSPGTGVLAPVVFVVEGPAAGGAVVEGAGVSIGGPAGTGSVASAAVDASNATAVDGRSEEHTSELQSHLNLVCRRQLEKTSHRAD